MRSLRELLNSYSMTSSIFSATELEISTYTKCKEHQVDCMQMNQFVIQEPTSYIFLVKYWPTFIMGWIYYTVLYNNEYFRKILIISKIITETNKRLFAPYYLVFYFKVRINTIKRQKPSYNVYRNKIKITFFCGIS